MTSRVDVPGHDALLGLVIADITITIQEQTVNDGADPIDIGFKPRGGTCGEITRYCAKTIPLLQKTAHQKHFCVI